jgi:hypothetical protein
MPGRSSRRDGNGQIPRRDRADNSDGLASDLNANVQTHRREYLSRQAHAFARKELEDLSCSHGLANAFDPGLAFLAGKQGTELLSAPILSNASGYS